MTRLPAGAVALTTLVFLGCQAALSSVRPPLQAEGEVYVYLQPLPGELSRLSFAAASVAARGVDGAEHPLALPPAGDERLALPGQRLLAWGRLAPGSYGGLSVRVGSAVLARADGKASLLVSPDPARADLPFSVEPGRATTLWLALDGSSSAPAAAGFSPVFHGSLPPPPVPGLAAWVTSPTAGTVTFIDRHSRQVMGVLHLDGEPQGVAFSTAALRAYVALPAEDALAVIDLATGSTLSRIRLRPGDRPRELAATPDDRLLVVANPGSSTVSLVDPQAQLEVGRLPVGLEPVRVLLDRAGRRAYVCSRVAATVTVVDLANQVVAGVLGTEAEPVALGLSRLEDKLYVAHAASPFLAVYATRTLARLDRVFVGMGAQALRVDPRSDLLYLGSRLAGLSVLEPVSLLATGSVDLPGAADAVIDDAENLLLAVVPGRDGVVAVDLASRRIVGVSDTAGPPARIAVGGERR